MTFYIQYVNCEEIYSRIAKAVTEIVSRYFVSILATQGNKSLVVILD
jgi:hypothetical protein